MEHLRNNVHPDAAFCIRGVAPSLTDLHKIIEDDKTNVVPVDHRFHFYVDDSVDQVLVLWFCNNELHQRKMPADTCLLLLDSLERAGFDRVELN